MKKPQYVMSNFICPECNCVIPIPRKLGHQREKGHIKDMFCPTCGEVRKFKEVRAKEFYKNLDGEIVYS